MSRPKTSLPTVFLQPVQGTRFGVRHHGNFITNGIYTEYFTDSVLHENTITNHRFSWMATFQGILFTAIAFAWRTKEGYRLVSLLSVVGGFVSALTYIALATSTSATYKLWVYSLGVNQILTFGFDDYMSRGAWCRYLSPWNSLTLVFLVAWSVVWGLNYGRENLEGEDVLRVLLESEEKS